MVGPEFIREQIPGADAEGREGLLHFTPMVFRQGNLDGFEAIAMRVAKRIPRGSKVCELYAGVGFLGLTALAHHARGMTTAGARPGGGDDDTKSYDDWWEDDQKTNTNANINTNESSLKWVRCSDENPSSQRCFSRAVNSMPIEVTGKIHRAQKYKNKMKDKNNTKGNNNKNRSSDTEMTMEEMMQNMMKDQNIVSSDSDMRPSDNQNEKITYMVASATKALYEGQALGANVLLVDPPRKGLDEEVLLQLCKPHNPTQDYTDDAMFLRGPRYSINWVNDADTLIYVSCGFDSLARDCDRLLKGSAGWKLESATGYVLFPGTNHVETLAVFTRELGRRMEI